MFFLFGNWNGTTNGGIDDLQGQYKTLKEAIAAADALHVVIQFDWMHIAGRNLERVAWMDSNGDWKYVSDYRYER